MPNRETGHRAGIHRREALGHLAGAAAAAAGVTTAPRAQADTYPSKPILLILPLPPGGSFDTVLRALCNAAAQDLGQPIVLMHKPGGGGVTGTASLATTIQALIGHHIDVYSDPGFGPMATPSKVRVLEEFDLYPDYRTAPAYRACAEAQLAKEKAMLDESGFKPK